MLFFIKTFILDSCHFPSLNVTLTVWLLVPLQSAGSSDLVHGAGGREVCARHQMHSDLCPVSGGINNFSAAAIVRGDAQTEDTIREPSRLWSDRSPAASLRQIKRRLLLLVCYSENTSREDLINEKHCGVISPSDTRRYKSRPEPLPLQRNRQTWPLVKFVM